MRKRGIFTAYALRFTDAAPRNAPHSVTLQTPANTFSIEPASWRDLGALRQIEQICFPLDAWPLLDLLGVLTFPNVVRLKAVAENRMVGFVAGDLRRSERLAWIATIGVLPEFRGQGIGTALLTTCEERLNVPTIKLCVRKSNDTAIRLYLRYGYVKVDEWPRYYTDREAAIVMEKKR